MAVKAAHRLQRNYTYYHQLLDLSGSEEYPISMSKNLMLLIFVSRFL